MAAKGKSTAAAEVIQDWADGEGGYTFERGRMEAAVRNLCFENPITLHSDQTTKPSIKLNRQDVDFITKELAIPRSQAEEALVKHQGDVTKSLIELMSPPPPTTAKA